MKLTFIGTGSAFIVGGNYQSNMFFESDAGKRLLVDCGSDVRHAMYELGLSQKDVNAVYISHLHADHVGGLEWLAFSTTLDAYKPKKVDLYCHKSLVKGLWSILSSGLSSLEGTEADLSTYFNIHELSDNGSFIWEGVEFHIFQTIHQISHQKLMPSYGLEVEIGDVQLLLTTDTRFPSQENPLRKKYESADIIFHDCETSLTKSGVHAHYTELVELDPEIKKKMWLYHYHAGVLPDASSDGFAGFVKKGQTFDLPRVWI